MLTGKQLSRLINAGATPKLLKIIGEILDQNCSEKVTNVTDRNARVTARAVYMRNYRRSKNIKEKQTPQVTRNDSVTARVTDEKKPLHIENAPAHESVLLTLNTLSSSQIEKKAKVTRSQISTSYTDEFLTFWQDYPPHNGAKSRASEKYQQAIRGGISHETIIAGARGYGAYILSEGIERRYTKHAATWLHERGWEVDYSAPAVGNAQRRGNGFAQPGKGELARAAVQKGLDEMENDGWFGRTGEG